MDSEYGSNFVGEDKESCLLLIPAIYRKMLSHANEEFV